MSLAEVLDLADLKGRWETDIGLPETEGKYTFKMLAPTAASLLVAITACAIRDARLHKTCRATLSSATAPHPVVQLALSALQRHGQDELGGIYLLLAACLVEHTGVGVIAAHFPDGALQQAIAKGQPIWL